MKKLSLLILAIAATAIGFAQTNSLDIATVKKVATDASVTSLKVYNNVEVILTDDSLAEIQVVGEKTDVENTSVKFSNGEVTITGAAKDLNGRVTVYVPAKFLDRVYIHGSSNISSAGLLNNELLDVIINGEGKSSIRTTGMISQNTIGDFPMDPSSI